MKGRQVIKQLRDDTSSLLWLKDSESILSKKAVSTTNSKVLDTVFEFDSKVFNSRAYQMVLRSSMKHVLSYKPSRHFKRSALASPNDAFLLGNNEVSVDSETIKAESVSDTSLIPRSVVPEQIVPRYKRQVGTPNDTLESQQCLLPWNGKTLILGSSKSGKSTLHKSLMLLIKGSYTLEERQSFKGIVFNNTFHSMRFILVVMEYLELSFEHHRNGYHVRMIFMQLS